MCIFYNKNIRIFLYKNIISIVQCEGSLIYLNLDTAQRLFRGISLLYQKLNSHGAWNNAIYIYVYGWIDGCMDGWMEFLNYLYLY